MAAAPRIDGHIHLWSDDPVGPHPYGRLRYPGDPLAPLAEWGDEMADLEPGSAMAEYARQGTTELLLGAMGRANVQGAMAVQVVFHGYDHSFIQQAVASHPTALRGGLVTDPLRGPEAAAAQVAELYAQGFTSVRFKANLWPGTERTGLTDAVGRAVMAAAGERAMPVAVLSNFVDDAREAEEIETLCRDFPQTPVLVDHFGGTGAATPFSGMGWQRLLALSKFDNAHIKLSGWVRGKEPICLHAPTSR